MAVFDGSVKTPRRVADPLTDKRVSSVASLTLPAINTPAALLYPGSDVSVIHGNQQLHVDQNRIMKVDMNQDVVIGMNEVYLVDMNRTMTVMQNYTRSVMMNSTISVTGNYVKSVLCDYTKTITGISTNTIFSDYFKFVHADYTKTIQGSSGNTITGSYTKIVQSDYVKQVTGSASITVISDYTKILLANYSKSITGNSTVTVTNESTVNYVGNHSWTYSSNNKTYIAGTNTHTTVGPTIRTEIGVTVTQQNDGHIDTHSDNLNQEKNEWFTIANRKGTWQRFLKLDYTTGLYNSAAIMKVDVNAANIGINSTANAMFLHKWDLGLLAEKTVAADNKAAFSEAKVVAVTTKAAGFVGKTCVTTVHAGATGVKFLGGVFQAIGAKIQAGVTWAFNQFM